MLGYKNQRRVYQSFHKDLGLIASKFVPQKLVDVQKWKDVGVLNQSEFTCPFILKYLLAKNFQSDVIFLMEYANSRAPELIMHPSNATNKVDIWSVGVVLYQLATHEYPISAGSVPELQ
ncbi:MAG: hypothetical protein EZS28_022191, partial [Streblomastix strix]